MLPAGAVFVGGFSLDAAEEVGGEGGSLRSRGKRGADAERATPSALALVASLVAKNLLVDLAGSSSIENPMPRFGMLETVREFALEQLEASGDGNMTRERHAQWCLQFGEEAWKRLWQQPLRLANLDRVEIEHDNMRAALSWLVANGDRERALHLATSLTPFWYMRSHRLEGLVWLQRTHSLASTEPIPTQLAARFAHCLGLLD